MDLISLAIITGGLLPYSLIPGRLQGTVVTAPLVFVIFGFVVGTGGPSIATIDAGHSAIQIIAEFILILVLFTDATRIDLDRVTPEPQPASAHVDHWIDSGSDLIVTRDLRINFSRKRIN